MVVLCEVAAVVCTGDCGIHASREEGVGNGGGVEEPKLILLEAG